MSDYPSTWREATKSDAFWDKQADEDKAHCQLSETLLERLLQAQLLGKMTTLDWTIVAILHNTEKRTSADIAAEASASERTVRDRLARLRATMASLAAPNPLTA